MEIGDTRRICKTTCQNAEAVSFLEVTATRWQLSMYVLEEVGHDIEVLRRVLDPIQSQLIPTHITLAREDELENLPEEELRRRLNDAALRAVTLTFGPAEAFLGHGLLLHCEAGEEGFQWLRQRILGAKMRRVQRPHITLAHPRNPKAPGNSLAAARSLPAAINITFAKVVLIEQKAGRPWIVIEEFNLPS